MNFLIHSTPCQASYLSSATTQLTIKAFILHVTWHLTGITGAMALISGMANAAGEQPIQSGTLIYLEQQAHTNRYPPAGGSYLNSGTLNQITDTLTWQNPATLQVEP